MVLTSSPCSSCSLVNKGSNSDSLSDETWDEVDDIFAIEMDEVKCTLKTIYLTCCHCGFAWLMFIRISDEFLECIIVIIIKIMITSFVWWSLYYGYLNLHMGKTEP